MRSLFKNSNIKTSNESYNNIWTYFTFKDSAISRPMKPPPTMIAFLASRVSIHALIWRLSGISRNWKTPGALAPGILGTKGLEPGERISLS